MKKVKNTIPIYDIAGLQMGDKLKGELIVSDFASYLEVHPNLHAPHRHSFYHLLFFSKGAGSHTIDFVQFKVQPGQIYFMVPGQVHSWDFEGEVDGYVVNFSETFFESFLLNPYYLEQFMFFRGIADDSVVNLPAELHEQVREALQGVLREQQQILPFSKDQSCAYLISIFTAVSRHFPPNNETRSLPQNQLTLFNFRKLVNQYYAEMRLPKEYAAMLYITPNHLNALCRDILGKPAGEIIRDRILLEAKRLLVNADLPVSDIAFQLGFTDNSHLTKFFKKHLGVTPEAFRKNAMSDTKRI